MMAISLRFKALCLASTKSDVSVEVVPLNGDQYLTVKSRKNMETFALYAGNLSQLFVALLAIGTLFFISKNKEVFGSELTKAQFEETHRIRTLLSEIFFDIHYVRDLKVGTNCFYQTLEELRTKSPEDWAQYERYKKNSLSLYYKFMLPSYYLLPSWIDKSEITKLYSEMKSFAPFTIYNISQKTSEEIQAYQSSIITLMELIDLSTIKHGGRK
jgi:hypothetical protein